MQELFKTKEFCLTHQREIHIYWGLETRTDTESDETSEKKEGGANDRTAKEEETDGEESDEEEEEDEKDRTSNNAEGPDLQKICEHRAERIRRAKNFYSRMDSCHDCGQARKKRQDDGQERRYETLRACEEVTKESKDNKKHCEGVRKQCHELGTEFGDWDGMLEVTSKKSARGSARHAYQSRTRERAPSAGFLALAMALGRT